MRSMAVTLLAAGMLASVLPTGGCVSKAEYDKALAANRRANEELLKSQEALRAVRAENDQLTADLAGRDRDLKAAQADLGIVTAARDDLQKRLNDLQALYDKLKAGPALPKFVALPPALDKALRDFARANPDLVEYVPEYGMVKLKSDLTFAPGSDDVQAEARAALGKFVEIVNSPEAARFHVYVAGHTDDIPIRKPGTLERHPDNWYLSVHRAISVEQILVKGGLAPERIGALGFGEYHPVAPNAPGKKGNVLNRRVEIWIVPPDRFLTPGGGAASPPAPEGGEEEK